MLEQSFSKRQENMTSPYATTATGNTLSASSSGCDNFEGRGSLYYVGQSIPLAPKSKKGSTSSSLGTPRSPATLETNPFFVEVPSIEVEGVCVDTARRSSDYIANYATRESVYQPYRKVTLCWDTLSVAKLPPEEKLLFVKKSKKAPVHSELILRSVSGVVLAGELTAVLGRSGSGKSVLLEVISGRLSTRDYHIDGKIYINNKESNSKALMRQIGYIPHNYPFSGALTVKEHLTFQSYLRIEERYTREEKSALVEDIMEEIGLSVHADVRIGTVGHLNGLWLCEQRLLALATECLTNPPVLCCDEPLHGLDGFEAERVMGCLKNITGRGKIVICALTRPTSEAFGLCDKLAVLHGGRTAYFGAVEDAVRFFGSAGYGYPSGFNPADHYVASLAGTAALSQLERNDQAKFICDKYLMSSMFEKIRRKLENTARMSRICETARPIIAKSTWRTRWLFQLMVFLSIGVRCLWRDPYQLGGRFAFHAFAGLCIGIVCLQQNAGTEMGIDGLNGVLWLYMALMSIFPIIGVVTVFLAELKLLHHEIRSNIYSISAYFVARIMLELPQHICFAGLLVTLSYWLVGLYPSAQAYVTACWVTALTSFTAEGFFLFIATVARRKDLTLTMTFAIAFPLFLLNGLIPRMAAVPGWLSWLSNVSWFRYSSEALTSNQWRYLKAGWRGVPDDGVGDYPLFNSTTLIGGSDVTAETIAVDVVAFNCGMLVLLAALFHITAFCLLLRFVRR